MRVLPRGAIACRSAAPAGHLTVDTPIPGQSGRGNGVLDHLRWQFGRHSTRDDVVQDRPPSFSRDAGCSPFSQAAPLRELVREALRAALQAEHRGAAADSEVRTLLRQACDTARVNDAHVERLLILLKEVWRELPQARHRTHIDAQAPLARVVTMCIDEYYATTPRGQ